MDKLKLVFLLNKNKDKFYSNTKRINLD